MSARLLVRPTVRVPYLRFVFVSTINHVNLFYRIVSYNWVGREKFQILITWLFLVFQCLRCFLMWCFQCLSVTLLHSVSRVFTARCTLVQSAVLRSHIVCLSVRLSVRLSICQSVCDVGEL